MTIPSAGLSCSARCAITPPRYPAFQRLITRIASSRPSAWLFARVLPPVDRFFLKLTGGRAAPTMLTELPMVILTTRGARSGRPHTTPLLRIGDDESPQRFAVVASNFGQRRHPAWYHNLKAHPRAQCTTGRHTAEYLAHEAHGEEYEQFWQRASELYPGNPRYQERAGRRIPIMVMEPAPPDRAYNKGTQSEQ